MPETSDEQNDRIQLAALRELLKEKRELQRLTLLQPAYAESLTDPRADEAKHFLHDTEQRATNAMRRIAQLEKFLASAEWAIQDSSTEI